MECWQPGDPIVLRTIWHGRVFGALAATVVEATPTHVVAWIGPGSDRKLPPGRHQPWDRSWTHADRPWHGEGVLMLKQLEAAHSIWLFREPGGAIAGWYGNLEEPARATRFGVDSRDNILDVWRPRDGDWRWKDEDEFAEAVRRGLFTEEEAAAIRAEGERVMRDAKVPTGWEDWQPDPAWPAPRLPEDWHVV